VQVNVGVATYYINM